MSAVTRILSQIDQGDPSAAEQLLPLVYDELRKLAAQKLAKEKSGQTLQATALVHEAYLRLVCGETEPGWNSRGHFFAAAATSMRRILIEQARRKQRLRHGGDHRQVTFDALDLAADRPTNDILLLDEALQRLSEVEPMVAKVVSLRYFAGLTIPQTAEALDISVRTTNRHWAFAKAWLFQQISEENDTSD